MSQENAAIVRQAYEAFLAGDFDSAFERIDTDEFVLVDPTRVDTTEYAGRTGFEKWLVEWIGSWDEWRMELEDVIAGGEQVVALCRQWGVGKDSGVEVEQPFAMVWTLRGGRVVKAIYFDRQSDALAAIGDGSGRDLP